MDGMIHNLSFFKFFNFFIFIFHNLSFLATFFNLPHSSTFYFPKSLMLSVHSEEKINSECSVTSTSLLYYW